MRQEVIGAVTTKVSKASLVKINSAYVSIDCRRGR